MDILGKIYNQEKMRFIILLIFWAEELIATGYNSVTIPLCPDKCVCTNDNTEIKCEQPNSIKFTSLFDQDVGSQGASKVQKL